MQYHWFRCGLSAMVLSALLLTGCSATVDAAKLRTTRVEQPMRECAQGQRRLMIAGDSILVGLEPFIEEHFHDRRDVAVLPLSRVATGLTNTRLYDWPRSLKKFIHDFNPDVVVTNFATNDYPFWSKNPDWEERYTALVEEIISIATSRGARMIWISPPVMGRKDIAEGIAKLNPLIRRICRAKGVTYVDISRTLATRRGAFERTRVIYGEEVSIRFKDGIHVGRPGNEILMSKLSPILDRALR